ncbi:hypothetical protein PBCVNEJV1_076L [Paramecium bursaria Chlorella virus NE-JV-1]|nr:hypothetical protein PBCVNEJV1_076L [Paramecium bursaria Chlorella virus NE-JV-1]
MFIPVCLDITRDEHDFILFTTFRKTLKNLLVDKYVNVHGSLPVEKMTSRQLMFELKSTISVYCPVKQTPRRPSDAVSCGKLIAETVFTIYSILCAMDLEFDTGNKIKKISKIIIDSPRGHPILKLIYIMDLIEDLSKTHDFFGVFSIGSNIESIDSYLEGKNTISLS